MMNNVTRTLIATLGALALSGGAYAQSNNTLARPSTTSPVAPTSGYGTPGAGGSESGMSAGSANSGGTAGTGNASTSLTNLPGSHNTLATPSTTSPAGQ